MTKPLHDIDFSTVHDHVTSGVELAANQFPPLRLGHELFDLVALDAKPYGQGRVFGPIYDHNIALNSGDIKPDHEFYQLTYGIVRNGTSLGDVSIQYERDKGKAYISAWHSVRGEGLALGAMELPEHGTLEALRRYLGRQRNS